MMTPAHVLGWDVGGAHVKACWLHEGRVRDVMQWPCPLWQGLEHLDAAIAAARARWPLPMAPATGTLHAVTMTGEVADLFASRAHGVAALAQRLAVHLPASNLRLYAGHAWLNPGDAPAHWASVASANWRATAQWAAHSVHHGLLVDIGSTTTDLIALRGGTVAARGHDDASRLASGELVYQGVVRTPLMALAQRMPFRGEQVNVMNELFATTADVYRLTGELDAQHDQHGAADGGAKDTRATQQRLARMVGRDATEGDADEWLALALAWRARQLATIEGELRRVLEHAALPGDAPLVAAGCGEFLVAELAARVGHPLRRFASEAVPLAGDAPADAAAWVQVCAPAAAVALLLAQAPGAPADGP